MLSTELARRFIERISEYTEYNVNIMDDKGMIIASRDPERVGTWHEIADRLIHGREDILQVSAGEDYRGVRPGINMVIETDGVREGAVGVTGDPDVIRPVAMIVKMAMETFIKYENQQEEIRRRQNRKAHFISLLTQPPSADTTEIRTLAQELGYPEDQIRIPILICLSDQENPLATGIDEALLEQIKQSDLHTPRDVSLILDDRHIVIYKTMQDTPHLFSDYKYVIGEYLSPALQWLREHDLTGVRFCIGSFQETYARYYYAYRHCKWLEEHVRDGSRTAWFYDHVRDYLMDVMPRAEMDHIYRSMEAHMPQRRDGQFEAMMAALIANNYHFGRAAKDLYIHKNTLVYRYNQIKEELNVDPLQNAADRAFLEGYYYYLCREHKNDA